MLIHFFSGSEIDTASSGSISILLSFVLSCVVCIHFSEILASLWQVNVLAVLRPELPDHGNQQLLSWENCKWLCLVKVISEKLQDFENKWSKMSDESLQNFRSSPCMQVGSISVVSRLFFSKMIGNLVVVITRGYAKVARYCIPEKLPSAFGDKANGCTFRGRRRDGSSVCHWN